MPLLKPDFTELKPIEAGTYPAKVVANVFKTSKEKGNPGLEVHLEVTVGDKVYGRKVWVSLSGKGAFMYDQLLRACHFDDVANQYMRGEGLEWDTDNLNDQQIQVIVEPDEYNGQVTDKIVKFLRA